MNRLCLFNKFFAAARAANTDFSFPLWHPQCSRAGRAMIVFVSMIRTARFQIFEPLLHRVPNTQKSIVFLSACFAVPGKHSPKQIHQQKQQNKRKPLPTAKLRSNRKNHVKYQQRKGKLVDTIPPYHKIPQPVHANSSFQILSYSIQHSKNKFASIL